MSPRTSARVIALLGILFLAAGAPPWTPASLAQSAGPAPIDPYQATVTMITPTLVQTRGNPGSLPAGGSVKVTNVSTGASVIGQRASDGSFIVNVAGRRNELLRAVARDASGTSSSPTDFYVGALTIKNPYTAGGYWFIGQTHMHSTASDGVNQPAAVEAAYHDRGYDFVVSTDHRGYSPNFAAPTSGLTANPNNAATGQDLYWIRGTELSNGYVHMGAWGESGRVPLNQITFVQPMIDAVRARGGIVAINHPESSTPPYAWDWSTELIQARGYSLVEAFNGSHEAHDPGRFNINTAIDLADAFQQVWWIGTDDCHDISDPLAFDRFAIVVQTDQATMTNPDLIGSADAGRMYIRETSSGPEIQGVSVAGNVVTVALKNIGSTYDVTWKQRGDLTVGTSSGVTTQASYTVQGGEGYVRAEVRRNLDGKRAWTQPLFVANASDLSVAASDPALADNNSSTVWDAGAAQSGFVIDVGAVRQLNALKIDWDGTDGRRFNYWVDASDTGAFAGEERLVLRTTYSNRSANTLDFFDESARYVRVFITGQTAGPADATARIREVQLYESTPGRTQLYVNNVSGDDANSGLAPGEAWLTPAYGATRVRPRDTLNFIRTAVPYQGPIEIGSAQSGKHSGATVEYRGDPNVLTPIDGTGAYHAVRFTDTQYFDMSHFDISAGNDRSVWFKNTRTGTSLRYSRIHNANSEGVLGAGKFLLAYDLIYNNSDEGIMAYQTGTDAEIYNNVISGNGHDGVLVDESGSATVNATIRNNVISANGGNALARNAGAGLVTDSHNCVSGTYAGSWQRTGNVDGNPLLLNPAAGQFALQGGSACIDAGVDLNFNSDFIGYGMFDEPYHPNTGSPGNYSRAYIDMGAYEYGSPCPDCPSCHD